MQAKILMRQLTAVAGIRWWVAGYRLFRRQPSRWIGSLMLFAAVLLLVSVVPVFGPLGATLLQPGLVAGLMLTARAVERGERLQFSDLFAGLRAVPGRLLKLGLVLGLASFTVLLVAYLPFAAMLGLGYFGSSLQEVPEWPDRLPEVLDTATLWTTVSVLVLAAFLAMPLAMAGWFAPMLVVFRGAGVVDALWFSLVASWRNLAPLSIYGALLVPAFLIATLPAGLGLLIFAPLMVTSSYTAYRELFDEDDGAPVA